MKKTKKVLGFIALIAMIGFAAISMIGCSSPSEGGRPQGGKPVDSIKITTPPTKLHYNLGEDLDLNGMVVTATYTDGTEGEVPVADCEINGYDKTATGHQTITVTYKDKTDEFGVNVIDPNKPTVTISASPEAGTYDEAISVILTAMPSEATIYYTTDGSEPSEESDVYTDPIDISETTTIKAFAVLAGYNDSDELVAEYVLIFSFTSAPEITLEPDNAKITYTWADSDPVADSYDVYWKEGSGLSAEEVKTSGTKIPGATSGGEITGLTNGTMYSVIVTANKADYVSIDSDVQKTMAGVTYIITGSVPAFTATKGGTTIGTAGQAIGTVFSAIRNDANGTDCIIQFGNGTDILDIGTSYLTFDTNWGAITLTGRITSAVGDYGTIRIESGSGSSVTSLADINNTAASNSRAITTSNSNYAVLTIAGGTVSAAGTGCVAVYHNSNSLLAIKGGTVSSASTTGRNTAVGVGYSSGNNGTVNISGGTVRAAGAEGIAVSLNSSNSGKITVSGGLVTSEWNDTNQYATIYLGDNAGVTDRLEITGGTVENTANGVSASAISNNSRGTVTISGGEVKGPRAIYNNAGINYPRTVNITGGTISTARDNGSSIYVDQHTTSNTTLNIFGGTVLATGNGGSAVYIRTGTILNISGGTVRSETGCAVYKADSNINDKITVSQAAGATTLVTSANTNASYATIYIANDGYAANSLEMTGGTVENTSTTTGNAIRNNLTGAVTISGGTVSKAGNGNYAVYKSPSAGTVTIDPAATIVGNNYGVTP
jgi:hypothetical protein